MNAPHSVNDPASFTAEVTVCVPFHDLDPAGIVWHGHYAKYFELARCALLRSFAYNYDDMVASGYSWPIIDLKARYVKSAGFEQEIRIRASLREWEYRLRIDYLVSDAATGLRLCKGRSDQVAVDLKTGEMCLRSPDVLFLKLGLTP